MSTGLATAGPLAVSSTMDPVVPDDAGTADAGGKDAGSTDGGQADGGEPDGGGVAPVHHDYGVGCDCQAGPGGAVMALLLLVGGLRARRRR